MPYMIDRSDTDEENAKINPLCSDFILSTKVVRDISEVDFFERMSNYYSSPSAMAKSKSEYRSYWPSKSTPLARSSGTLSVRFDVAMKGRSRSSEFSDRPMSLPNLSMLILATFGLKEKGAWIYEPTESNPWPKRSAASAGGLYPLEIYPLVIGPVEGLELGLYHLNIKTFSLEPLPLQVRFDEIPNIIPALNFATNAKVVFLIVGVFPRSYGKYGRRAYRFVLIEVGHVQAHLGLPLPLWGWDILMPVFSTTGKSRISCISTESMSRSLE